MCGLILKEITCRVRIYHPRRVPVCINKVRARRRNLEWKSPGAGVQARPDRSNAGPLLIGPGLGRPWLP